MDKPFGFNSQRSPKKVSHFGGRAPITEAKHRLAQTSFESSSLVRSPMLQGAGTNLPLEANVVRCLANAGSFVAQIAQRGVDLAHAAQVQADHLLQEADRQVLAEQQASNLQAHQQVMQIFRLRGVTVR